MRNCLICHSEKKQVLFDSSVIVPQPYPLLGEQTLVQCQQCGFIYADSTNSEANYQDYYLTLNKHKKRAADASVLDQAYFDKIVNLLDFVERDVSILDFGSGDLLMQQLLQGKGFQSVSTYDVDTEQSANKYDVIISTHTFEHILHADVVVQQCREMLNDEGIVLIAVPDVFGYDDCYYGAYNALDLEHINHFSITSLQNLFISNGFDIVFSTRDKREVRPELFYPETIVIGRKAAKDSQSIQTTDIRQVYAVVTQYLEHSARDFARFTDKLLPVASHRKIFWGLGISAMRLLLHVDVGHSLFVDSDSRLWGRTIAGNPILSPDAVEKVYTAEDVFVVVAVNTSDIVTAIRNRFGQDSKVIVM